ncbi:MAG: Fe-S cluster assembly protein SufD [Halodesulfurarchaeum sp.]
MSVALETDITEETVREISGQFDEPEWLLETRLDAVAAIDELDFPPVIKTPGRRWTNLEDLDYDRMVDPLSQTAKTEREMPEDVRVLPFHEALDELPDVLEEQFGRIVDPQQNRLTALSTALFTNGTVVYVPEGVDAESVTIRTEMRGRSLFNYTLVITETNSSVTILERQRTTGGVEDVRYYSGIVEIAAGENSYVQYGSLQDFDSSTYNYTLKRGRADTYGTIDWIEGNLGSRLTKTQVGTELTGDSSETKIVGAFFGTDDQHFDLDSKVWHRGEHTNADLVTRGVIDDSARSVYEGVQDVGREAWDTNSYQRENTLMLSDDSEADASPKLIINNHDTEASHSATVGQVDREDLFYMITRGLSEDRAEDMLVQGFFVPVLEEIAVEELRQELEDRIESKLAS